MAIACQLAEQLLGLSQSPGPLRGSVRLGRHYNCAAQTRYVWQSLMNLSLTSQYVGKPKDFKFSLSRMDDRDSTSRRKFSLISSADGQLSWYRCRSSVIFLRASSKWCLSTVEPSSSRVVCRTGSKSSRSRRASSLLRVSLSSLIASPHSTGPDMCDAGRQGIANPSAGLALPQLALQAAFVASGGSPRALLISPRRPSGFSRDRYRRRQLTGTTKTWTSNGSLRVRRTMPSYEPMRPTTPRKLLRGPTPAHRGHLDISAASMLSTGIRSSNIGPNRTPTSPSCNCTKARLPVTPKGIITNLDKSL